MKLKVCNKKTKLMFPEYRDMIQQLREDNPDFSKIKIIHSTKKPVIRKRALNPIAIF